MDAVTAAVVASKPSALEGLLFRASYNLEQWSRLSTLPGVAGISFLSAHADRLGTPCVGDSYFYRTATS